VGLLVSDKGCGVAGGQPGMWGCWWATRDMGLLVGDKGCGVAGGRQGMRGCWWTTRDAGLLVGDKGCVVAGGHVCSVGEASGTCVCFGERVKRL